MPLEIDLENRVAGMSVPHPIHNEEPVEPRAPLGKNAPHSSPVDDGEGIESLAGREIRVFAVRRSEQFPESGHAVRPRMRRPRMRVRNGSSGAFDLQEHGRARERILRGTIVARQVLVFGRVGRSGR